VNPLMDLVLEHDELAELDPAQRRLALKSLVTRVVGPEAAAAALPALADAIDGFGPLSALMREEDVTDVLVNGPGEVWVERGGSLQRAEVGWSGEAELRTFIARWLGAAGARADASHPIADARLEDGSRIHVVLPPIAPRGPLVSIRRWPSMGWSLDELVEVGMLDEEDAFLLRTSVVKRRSIAISGSTGSGKTTLMNALLQYVSEDERVVVIEETPELRPRCSHHVSLIARPPNVEGKGAIELDQLVRASLRMRPDRIVVGEVRGREALTALDAMATGHEGSMVTVHARSARDALERLVALSLQAGSAASEESLRARVLRSFDLVAHLERQDGRRVLAELHEVG
jgi:pilus assembly protein CpaF